MYRTCTEPDQDGHAPRSTGIAAGRRYVGEPVIANGYPGTITRVCEWAPSMVEVRLQSGTVCVPYGAPDCYHDASRDPTPESYAAFRANVRRMIRDALHNPVPLSLED